MDILNKTRLSALCLRINAKKGAEVATDLDSCIDNLEYLLEDKTVDGESRKYLPLSIKEELFHLIYPDGYVHCETIFHNDTQMASCEAYVYADASGEHCIGEGLADQKVSEVNIFDGADRAIQATRRICKGRAKSDALRDAGIASWFCDDFLSDVSDTADEDINNGNLPSEDRSAEVENAIKENIKMDVVNEDDDENVVPESKKNPARPINEMLAAMGDSDDDGYIPFEESTPAEGQSIERSYVLHGGKCDGKNLGDVEKEMPEYMIYLFNLWKSGKWKKVDKALLQNIAMIVTQDREAKIFDDALSSYGLTYDDFVNM